MLAKKNLSFKKKTFPPQVLQEKVLGKFPLTPRAQKLNHERTSTVRKILIHNLEGVSYGSPPKALHYTFESHSIDIKVIIRHQACCVTLKLNFSKNLPRL